ncbi:MAG TPA: hypothetical protein VFO16_24245 [Pseudonocardiaceae bacterium]|nr:hypothetical protein [Pseudonocardiaceae bacterium]
MSTELLVTLTVVEIVALVAVLALFVIAITARLRSIATTLGHVSGVVLRSIQGNVFLVGAGAAILNRQLDAIAGMLPAVAQAAESLPARQARSQIPRQSRTEMPGNARHAASDPDPMIKRG